MVQHKVLGIGAIDVRAVAVGFDQAGEFKEGHFFEEADFQEPIVVEREGGAHVVAAVEASVTEGAEEHVTIEKRLPVDLHTDVVAA